MGEFVVVFGFEKLVLRGKPHVNRQCFCRVVAKACECRVCDRVSSRLLRQHVAFTYYGRAGFLVWTAATCDGFQDRDQKTLCLKTGICMSVDIFLASGLSHRLF